MMRGKDKGMGYLDYCKKFNLDYYDYDNFNEYQKITYLDYKIKVEEIKRNVRKCVRSK